jgi:V8-like Glu-specific endopeptidase
MEFLGKQEKKPIDFIERAHEHPFSSVGIVVSKKMVSKKMIACIGTGFLIGPNVALTCAHNVHQVNLRKDHEEI